MKTLEKLKEEEYEYTVSYALEKHYRNNILMLKHYENKLKNIKEEIKKKDLKC